MKKKIIKLKPIHETKKDYEELEEIIKKFFRDEIFSPILSELLAKPKSVLNEKKDFFLQAIKSNKVRFAKGKFTGEFSASISKKLIELGAKWDNKTKSFKIEKEKLPTEVKSEISVSQANFKSTISKIDQKLNSAVFENIGQKIKIDKFFNKAIWKTNKSIEKSVKSISVMPEITDEQRKYISKEYTNNLEKYINDFAKKEVVELRKSIQANYLKGARYEDMIKTIQGRYDVSKNKAKFLARQETSLMNAALKKSRYDSVGIKKYVWKTVVGSPNHPVRKIHKELDGTIQFYDKPPVTDTKGSRNNPGQDFNCRCYDIPIVEI